MYTRIPSYNEENEQEARIPIPEHYGGIAFATPGKEHTEPPVQETAESHEVSALPTNGGDHHESRKSNPFSFLFRGGENGREDMLLLVLALLLLDGDGGDEPLALMLLALLFLG